MKRVLQTLKFLGVDIMFERESPTTVEVTNERSCDRKPHRLQSYFYHGEVVNQIQPSRGERSSGRRPLTYRTMCVCREEDIVQGVFVELFDSLLLYFLVCKIIRMSQCEDFTQGYACFGNKSSDLNLKLGGSRKHIQY